MTEPLNQAYARVIGSDAKAYQVRRSQPPVPYIPDVPVLIKTSRLIQFRAQNNGIGGPVDPAQDLTTQRDIALKPWYGIFQHKNPLSPYAPTGPTPSQVGTNMSWAEALLPSNWYNLRTVNATTITAPIGSALAPIVRKVFWGTWLIRSAGRIFANNCMFPGPSTTANLTGETAIINCDRAKVQSIFKDCSIFAQFPHPRLNGFKGCCHKIERCHIFWVVDGDGPHSDLDTEASQPPLLVEIVATRIERMVYFPGYYGYADHYPRYWNGTTYVAQGTAGIIARTAADKTPFIDDNHEDGNHSDPIEIHSAGGSHTFNPTTGMWSGNGGHFWGNAFIADDAYQQGDPSSIGIPVPGQSGSPSGSSLGWGDSPRRGLAGGGQKPGMTRPVLSGWTKPTRSVANISFGGRFAANGTAFYVGQVRNILFPFPTTIVIHDNFLNNGNMAFQEQKKSLASIAFYFYDNLFGPDYFCWNASNNSDLYPVRINDLASGAAMPTDWTSTIVKLQPHPVTGTQPFGAGGNNLWWDPEGRWGRHLQPLLKGSSTVPGARFG